MRGSLMRFILNTMSHLSDDQPGQSHASDGADQLDCGPVVDVAVLDCELLRLRLIIVNCKIGKSKLEMCVCESSCICLVV